MLIRSFDSKLLLADGGSPIGRKLFSAKPGEEMKVSSNAKQTLSQMDIERAPTTAELNEPKMVKEIENQMRWYRIVARHFSVLLTFFFITALLAGLLSESNYCYYIIGRVVTVDRQKDNLTAGSCCGPIQLGRQGPAQSQSRDRHCRRTLDIDLKQNFKC